MSTTDYLAGWSDACAFRVHELEAQGASDEALQAAREDWNAAKREHDEAKVSGFEKLAREYGARAARAREKADRLREER